jgi:hypothetical protein
MTPLHPDAELPAGAISRKKQDELQSPADVVAARHSAESRLKRLNRFLIENT